ncbi:HesB/IscA family protein [Alicyclobacillus sp. ALC3]|uniref:HesB/IscA family protein n=1 Tax=Alicyclobacillus sp. ALC3 TaxID=2796143 RepID=UPI00237855F5|nr:iron-sulfur cluster assembly accessory protein [Alicyclobacillus sp. ALC3]
MVLTLSDSAAEKLREMLADAEEGVSALRIYTKPGGCSGFSYGMALDAVQPGDDVFALKGIQIAVEKASERLIDGAQLDFVDDLTGQGFKINNPNATTTCGCGASFRTAEDAGQPGSCD